MRTCNRTKRRLNQTEKSKSSATSKPPSRQGKPQHDFVPAPQRKLAIAKPLASGCAATRWLSRTSPGRITSQVALSPKKSVFIGEGWRRGGGGPQSGRPLLRPRDPAAAQIAGVRRNNFAEGDRAPSGARKRHLVIGAVHGLTLCTQGHRFARGPREQIPRSERI